jgi:biliverdin reductase
MIRVGLVGTGHAAKSRAIALAQEPRAQLVAVAGQTQLEAFAATHQIPQTFLDWRELVAQDSIDLIVVANQNCWHGAIAQAALESGKSVVVEYPLALDWQQGLDLLALARRKNLLLHIEHIELLGGAHQSAKSYLDQLGPIFSARYCTRKPEPSLPPRWTYRPSQFGFPLVGALSRLQRLTDLLGPVESVFCQLTTTLGVDSDHYRACHCQAQLKFKSGAVGDVIYAKGSCLWQAERSLELHGELGAVVYQENQGRWISPKGQEAIALPGRQGLFARDTRGVMDYLLDGQPLYVQPEASLYALQVAAAAERSAITGQVIHL